MNNGIITFPIKTGTKTRLITTYKNNQTGIKLRKQHQEILVSLDHNIFNYDVTYAYLKTQNTKKLVQKHVKNNFFYQLDIKDFFSQIDHDILLSKLHNANITAITNEVLKSHQLQGKGIGIGLLLSPFLSNLYLKDFDHIILAYCQKHDIIYTRYADDLTFSTFDKIILDELNALVKNELSKLNLQLNQQKTTTTYLTKNTQSVKILGINIVRGKESNYLTISRKFKAETFKINDEAIKNARLNYIKFNDQNFML